MRGRRWRGGRDGGEGKKGKVERGSLGKAYLFQVSERLLPQRSGEASF